MDDAIERPKILVLRKTGAASRHPDHFAHWIRLSKALKTFTDLVEEEISSFSLAENRELIKFQHVFLDIDLVDWSNWVSEPAGNITLVQATSWDWSDIQMQAEKMAVLTKQSYLILNQFSTSDLVRIMHLYLFPKRLAGVTPLMEKGSLILGEKLMTTHNTGILLDRFSTYCQQSESFLLKERLPDLRQVLSGLLQHGLQCATKSKAIYPFVDFQLSASSHKLAINLRFPRINFSCDSIREDALRGSDIFWQQIWLCSDLTLVTYHREHEEIEVMALICVPEKTEKFKTKTLLCKETLHSQKKENLLDAPKHFIFKPLSEIQIRSSEEIFIFSAEEQSQEAFIAELSALPEAVTVKFKNLQNKNNYLNEELQRREQQVKDYIKNIHQLNQQLAEFQRALKKTSKTKTDEKSASKGKNSPQEAILEDQQTGFKKSPQGNPTLNPAAQDEIILKLESMLKISESERTQLRGASANDLRKISSLEQKVASLHKEISIKESEIKTLKSALNIQRKDQLSKQAKLTSGSGEDLESISAQLKESEKREALQRQEIKTITLKLENQEKIMRAIQVEPQEKIKALERKLRDSKLKEVELLKKIEELNTTTKKIKPAA